MGGRGKTALRAIGRLLNEPGDGGIATDPAGDRVWCAAGCGRPVRSKLGAVCSRPECQKRYLARFEPEDED
ncbi:hypothetical protein [Nocardioides sp.]|uniref:hypothetical protein n=1 Tax=Nocardioides sp. TaxID=35761 RepID=UPI003D0C1C1C